MLTTRFTYWVEKDEAGTWCAYAPLPNGGACGDGSTQEAAIESLRTSLQMYLEDAGPAVLTLEVACG